MQNPTGLSRLEESRLTMKMENAIRVLAGSMMLICVALTYFVSPWWLLLGVFVGLNLIQSAFTGFCPAETILGKLGVGGSCCSKPCCGSHPEPGKN